jgi:hypothetical protein
MNDTTQSAITTNLYIDPLTARIVYLTQGTEFPVKSMVISDGKLTLFALNSVAKIAHLGELPKELNAQNCWSFQVRFDEDKKISVIPAQNVLIKNTPSSVEVKQSLAEDRAIAA